MAALASSIPQRTTTTLLERAATIARSYPVDVLDLLEEYSFTPRQIALLRIRFLTFNGDEIDDSDSAKHNDIVTKASEWMDSGMNNDSRPDWKAAGLSSVVVALLQNAVSTFFTSLTTSPRTTNDERLSEASSVPVISHDATRSWLFRLLAFVYRMVSVDPILAEEIGLLGAHPMLIRLMQHDEQQASEVAPAGTAPNNKIYQLDMEELQDVAGNIAACSRPFFPILLLQTNTTGTLRDWQARLPLVFKFHHGDKGHTENTLLGLFSNAEAGRLPAYIVDVPVTEFSHATILIHQVTARQSAQSDVGFVLWPSSVALASWLATEMLFWMTCNDMEDPSGFKVLELGAGCGLTGLVSARLLENIRQSVATLASARVILTDFNSTVIENLNRNVALNDLNDICSVVGLDFYCVESRENGKWCDMDGVSHPPVDVIIGADIICQASDAAAVATTLSAVLKKNGVAFIVCADAAHRFGVEHLTRQCQEVGLLVYTQNAGEFLDSSQTKNLEQTTGYVEDMHLTLFVVHKRGTI